jgi:cytidine deaminase
MPNKLYGAAIEAAQHLIALRGKEGRHHVAATVLSASGASYTAVHLESALGRAAVCAEAVGIGMAAAAEDAAEIIFSVAVNQRGEVIPPCGLCRELLLDYGPDSSIAVSDEDGVEILTLTELVPCPCKPNERGLA